MLLEVRGLHTYYGKSHILNDVSLDIDNGETVALLGRNGFGKSTTLKSIMGLAPPQRGTVRFRGEDIRGLKPYLICRRGIGFVPQERRIFPTLTVRQNLLLGLRPTRNAEEAWTIDMIYEHFPELARRDRQKGRSLSGGEQQMLTLARTLLGNPELLLVDEPTEGLSPQMTDLVLNMIQAMQQKGHAIILVEHTLEIALRMAQRAYVMSRGGIVWSGTKADFLADDAIRRQYLEV
jgi:branched-chain amino acid transport system ATP-binding protein